MTYLNIVNAVLRKLREDQVTSIQDNDYSILVGDFVNDALSFVEASWDWSCLRETLSLNTTAGESELSLTGFGTRSELMSIYNVGKKIEITQKTKSYIKHLKYTGTNTLGSPYYFAFNGTDTNNDSILSLYPTPDDIYFIDVNVVLRDEQFVNPADSTKLPTKPIVQLAFAYALRERGETGGQNAMEQIQIAKDFLSNSIALDAGLNQGELVFTEI